MNMFLIAKELFTRKGMSKYFFRNYSTIIKPQQLEEMQEKKILVNGVKINYLKTGIGSHAVLLSPGAIGSTWTDFKPQINHLNKDKFTLIVWDPPGYGKSRPPNREFNGNFYREDAYMAHSLMQALGYEKFSLIGWSDGSKISMILAGQYPNNIKKMIIIAGMAYITEKDLQVYEKYRNIDEWSSAMRKPLIDVYGDKYLREIWSKWVDSMKNIFENLDGDICKNDLRNIMCPCLIVYGLKDNSVQPEHQLYLKGSIKNSRLEIFEDGGHNLHLRFPEEFNALANQFLTE